MQISANQVIGKHALQTPSSLSVPTTAGLKGLTQPSTTKTTVRKAHHKKCRTAREKKHMIEVHVQPKQQHVTRKMLSYRQVEWSLQWDIPTVKNDKDCKKSTSQKMQNSKGKQA
jgi:hypothetical protein